MVVRHHVVAAMSYAAGWGVMCRGGARGVRARRERCTDSACVECEGCRDGVEGVCEVAQATRMLWKLRFGFYERQ